MAGSGSLDRSVVRGLVALESDRERASPLVAQLRDGQRCWSELSEEEKALLQGAPLIDWVLDRSFALRYDNPDEMVALAETGRLLAESLILLCQTESEGLAFQCSRGVKLRRGGI